MASRYRPARGTAAKSRPPARRYTAQTDRDMTRGSPHRRQTSHLPAARPVPCPAAREAHLCRPRPPRPKRPSAFQIPSRSATRPLFCATYAEPAALRPPARNPAPAQFPRTPSAKRAAEPQPIFAISPILYTSGADAHIGPRSCRKQNPKPIGEFVVPKGAMWASPPQPEDNACVFLP